MRDGSQAQPTRRAQRAEWACGPGGQSGLVGVRPGRHSCRSVCLDSPRRPQSPPVPRRAAGAVTEWRTHSVGGGRETAFRRPSQESPPSRAVTPPSPVAPPAPLTPPRISHPGRDERGGGPWRGGIGPAARCSSSRSSSPLPPRLGPGRACRGDAPGPPGRAPAAPGPGLDRPLVAGPGASPRAPPRACESGASTRSAPRAPGWPGWEPPPPRTQRPARAVPSGRRTTRIEPDARTIRVSAGHTHGPPAAAGARLPVPSCGARTLHLEPPNRAGRPLGCV